MVVPKSMIHVHIAFKCTPCCITNVYSLSSLVMFLEKIIVVLCYVVETRNVDWFVTIVACFDIFCQDGLSVVL